MTSGRGVAVLAIALAALAASSACKRTPEQKGPPPRPAPMPEAEVKRGLAACDDLVVRTCACAAAQPTRPELAEACQLEKTRPEALALAMETALRDDVSPDAVLRAQAAARTIIEKCVQAVATLPTRGCS